MLEQLPALRHVVSLRGGTSPGMYNFAELLNLAGPAQRARLGLVATELDPDDPINVQFTSGTTGAPKRRDAKSLQHCQQRAICRCVNASGRS